MANSVGISPAYSNQAFEYWLILHFENHQGGAMHRDDYADKINQYLAPLGVTYDAKGSKKIEADLFKILMGTDKKTGEKRLELAIKRAESVLNYHGNILSPASTESCTTVFKLVRELLRFV